MLIDKVLFWRLHLGIFLLFSVHQFTTLFFRKTYNWGSSFWKIIKKNHLIFCGERKLPSLIKYPCHGKYALVKVSHVVVNFLPPVHFFWSYPKQINFFKEFFETFDILEIAFFHEISLSSQDNRTGVRINFLNNEFVFSRRQWNLNETKATHEGTEKRRTAKTKSAMEFNMNTIC